MKTNYEFNEEFYSIPFYVDSRVLIPRNDTEILVDQVIKYIKKSPNQNTTFIDVWTGSSAILTAIIRNFPNYFRQAFWVDISLDALEVAKINIQKNALEDKVQLLNSDLLEGFLKPHLTSPYQGRDFPLIRGIKGFSNIIITANLPYIKDWDIENMDKEVLENEPHLALFGWPKTGFEMYEKLINQIFELKKFYNLENIILFIEIWFDQYEYSRQYLSSLWLKFEYFKDLNNIYRVIKINFN